MYIAMPNTFVKWSAALLGTFVSGTLFQIARLAFGRYFELVWQNYSDIYGALADACDLRYLDIRDLGDNPAGCGGLKRYPVFPSVGCYAW